MLIWLTILTSLLIAIKRYREADDSIYYRGFLSSGLNASSNFAQSAHIVDGGQVVLTGHGEDSVIPTIGMVTMLYGEPDPVYEQALQTHIEHGELHGYRLTVLRQKLLGRCWSKPAYLLSLVLTELQKPVKERLEWLFWFDGDTLISNPTIPIEMFLPPSPEFDHIHFLAGYDHNGLNAGVLLLRVDDYTMHLLAAVLTVESFRPSISLQFSDQSALQHIVESEDILWPSTNFTYAQGFAKVPQRWFNAYMGPRAPDGAVRPKKQFSENSVKEGDMLIHFAGHGDTKASRMSKFLKTLKKGRNAWVIPAEDTEYGEEIASYWKEMRVASHDSQKTSTSALATATQTLPTSTQLALPLSFPEASLLPKDLKPRSHAPSRVGKASVQIPVEYLTSDVPTKGTKPSQDPNLRVMYWKDWEVRPGIIRSEKYKKPKVGFGGR